MTPTETTIGPARRNRPMLIDLYNAFHMSRVTLRIEIGQPLTERQVRRSRRALCGVDGCSCAESRLGTRGPQDFEIEDDGHVVVLRDIDTTQEPPLPALP